MPRALANGLTLEYDTFGTSTDPAVLLISGLGSQMITWYVPFCESLASRGFFVIRFDNRDAGLSTKMEGPHAGPYSLFDMADDAVALLDALELADAHVVGVSMGGMIGQSMAIRHPRRVRTLTSIMSTTGAPGVGRATAEAAARLGRPGGSTRDERVASAIETSRALWGDSPQFPFDEELARWRAEATTDRAYYPEGTARQLMAIQAGGDRTEALQSLTMPTLVIHGTADPLVDVSGGEATAAAIPGARLMLIEGMGHGLPRQAWSQIVVAIAELASADDAAVGRA